MRKNLACFLGIGLLLTGVVVPIARIYTPMAAYAEGVELADTVATLDGTNYDSLDAVFAAVNADTTGAKHEIKLLGDLTAGGYILESGKNLVFDLNGHTLTMGTRLVGSTGTETLSWQILKDSTVVFKNGKMVAVAGSGMMIQNYANLTITDVEIDATAPAYAGFYAVSNNNGTVLINGNTSIKVRNGRFALDACWAPNRGYPDGTQVVVDTTGEIDGVVQVDLWGTMQSEGPVKTTLELRNGVFKKALDIDSRLEAGFKITGGDYKILPEEKYFEEGYVAGLDEDGMYRVVNGEDEKDEFDVEVEEDGNGNPINVIYPAAIDWGQTEGIGSTDEVAGAILGDINFNEEFTADRKAVFEVVKITDEDMAELKADNGKLVISFDANLRDRNGNKIEVEGTSVTIRVELTEEQYNTLKGYEEVKVVYFDDEGKEAERLNATIGEITIENEKHYYLAFTTSHLSTYGAIGVNNSEIQVANTGLFTASKGNLGAVIGGTVSVIGMIGTVIAALAGLRVAILKKNRVAREKALKA